MKHYLEIDYDQRPEPYWSRRGGSIGLPHHGIRGTGQGGDEDGAGEIDELLRFRVDEREIASIALAGGAPEHISVRARPVASGRIAYRIVDSSGNSYDPEPAFTDEPLTLEELVRMLDDSGPGGLIRSRVRAHIEESSGNSEAPIVVTPASEYYPHLGRHYALLVTELKENTRGVA